MRISGSDTNEDFTAADEVGGVLVTTVAGYVVGRPGRWMSSAYGDSLFSGFIGSEEPWTGGKEAADMRHLAAMAYAEARSPELRVVCAAGCVRAFGDDGEKPATTWEAVKSAARAAARPVVGRLVGAHAAAPEWARKELAAAEAARGTWDAGLRLDLTAHGIRPETCQDSVVAGVWREAALALRSPGGEWGRRAAAARVPVLQPSVTFGHARREGRVEVAARDAAPVRLYVVDDAAEGLALWQMLKHLGEDRGASIVSLGVAGTGRGVHEEVAKRARGGQRVDVVFATSRRPEDSGGARADLQKSLGEAFGGVAFGVYAPPRVSWVETVRRREQDWIRKQGLEARERNPGRGLSI